MIHKGKVAAKYAKLDRERNEVLHRAELAAKVTIPHICPPEGHTENSRLPDPYQGLGARAVNTLAAKIVLALFPPNTAFFKTGLDQLTQASLQGGDGGQLAEANQMLALYETIAVQKLEQTRLRSVAAMLVKHLIVTGNGALRVSKDEGFKFFPLRSYVVQRDPEGDVLYGIIKEVVSPEALSEEVRQAVMTPQALQQHEQNGGGDPLDVYTVQTREGKKFKVWQEINDTLVPGSEGSYTLEAPLFLFLRWTQLPDESYGRGQVDEYYGDFKALDDLSRDLLDASAAAAKVIFLRDPNSFISERKLAEAKSGDILTGRREDIGTVGVDKLQDFQISLERMRDIRREITDAFLMHSSVQRNAERVTAEEIRFMAQELEDALGGVYSILAQELQMPLAKRWLKILTDKQLLPPLPREGVNLTITTGLDALGRGHEIARIDGFLRQAQELLGPEAVNDWINPKALLERLSAGWGVPKADFINDAEQVQQAQQQRAMQQMAQQAVPGMAQEAMRQGEM